MKKNLKALRMGLVVAVCRILDLVVPKQESYWIFPIHFKQKKLTDNMRAVFEEVKNDPEIKKIVLAEQPGDFDPAGCENTEVLPLNSLKAFRRLIRSKVILVQHSLHFDLEFRKFWMKPISMKRHFVVNLWHGVSLKYIQANVKGSSANDEHARYSMITCSSKVDRLVMHAGFSPVSFDDIHITGLPRNDFLVRERGRLPSRYREALDRITGLKDGRRLVLYAPTYREIDKGGDYYEFTAGERKRLTGLLDEKDVLLGLRLHYFKNSTVDYGALLDHPRVVNLDQSEYPDISMLMRASDIIVTDYSSLSIDASYIDKPQLCFAYDFDHYIEKQRGAYYDFRNIFPGLLCYTFDSLLERLELLLAGDEETIRACRTASDRTKDLFFEYFDGDNSRRVVDTIFQLNGVNRPSS